MCGLISIGWDGVGDLSALSLDTGSLVVVLEKNYPDASAGTQKVWAGTLRRFHNEVGVDDIFVAPFDEGTKLRFGMMAGPYYLDGDAADHPHRIPVTWQIKALTRKELPQGVRATLTSISKLYRVLQHPEFFLEVSSHPEGLEPQLGRKDLSEPSGWLVGASQGERVRTAEFVAGG